MSSHNKLKISYHLVPIAKNEMRLVEHISDCVGRGWKFLDDNAPGVFECFRFRSHWPFRVDINNLEISQDRNSLLIDVFGNKDKIPNRALLNAINYGFTIPGVQGRYTSTLDRLCYQEILVSVWKNRLQKHTK